MNWLEYENIFSLSEMGVYEFIRLYELYGMQYFQAVKMLLVAAILWYSNSIPHNQYEHTWILWMKHSEHTFEYCERTSDYTWV